MAKPLRLGIGLLVLFFPIYLGWQFRHPLVVPLLGAFYVPLYILGKAGVWQGLSHPPSRAIVLKSLPLTFVVQCALVGLLYLVGLGANALFGSAEMASALTAGDALWIGAFAAVTVPLTILVAYAERPRASHGEPAARAGEPAARAGTADHAQPVEEGDDFSVVARTITPETFFHGVHHSRRDAVNRALTTGLDHNGEKPVHHPKDASDAMIAQAEDRLGVTLPQTLRALYKTRNGGTLPCYYVPREEGAARTHDDWLTAFADDYNELLPLERIRPLQEDYDQDFDPEFGREEDKAHWIAGADRLFVLAARDGYGTALDYRDGPEPGVLLFDHNSRLDTAERMRFDTFDLFFAALREIIFDLDGPEEDQEPQVFGAPPNPSDPERFWTASTPGGGVTKDLWRTAGEALGVALPDALYPFYAASDGGTPTFKVALPDGDADAPVTVFPGRYPRDTGRLVAVDQMTSLATLSDRLEFADNRTAWRALYDAPDQMIVISASYDAALVLDYTHSADPSVVLVRALDDPSSAMTFGTAEAFIARLRRFGIEKYDTRDDIGDPRISNRLASPETFWIADGAPAPAPVSGATVKAAVKTWGLGGKGMPETIAASYAQQNGGAVLFRFAPPVVVTATGHRNRTPSASDWIDVLPDGLLQMEDWQDFDQWRKEKGLAAEQSLYTFADRIDPPYQKGQDDTTLRLVVIGDHSTAQVPMVTLLDLSQGPFVRNANLLTLRYDASADSFDIVFGPISVAHHNRAVFQVLKARKADL